jgi:hypothetical protein
VYFQRWDAAQMLEVLRAPVGEIIQYRHPMPIGKQPLHEMAADESCSAGY